MSKQNENGLEPAAPITRKGILMSFKTGKSMNIPETDLVSVLIKKYSYKFSIMLLLFCFSWVGVDLFPSLRSSTG